MDNLRRAKHLYKSTVRRAGERNIEYKISFEEWYNWWLSNGVDKNVSTGWVRGNTKCMSRFGDKGPYSLDNIFVSTISQNSADAFPSRKRHAGRFLPKILL